VTTAWSVSAGHARQFAGRMIRGLNTPAVSGAATIADSLTMDPSGSATLRERRTIAVIASHPAAT
jgi:hypothetical protein